MKFDTVQIETQQFSVLKLRDHVFCSCNKEDAVHVCDAARRKVDPLHCDVIDRHFLRVHTHRD